MSSLHLCPHLFSNLLLNVFFLFRVHHDPILIILASEGSRGIFDASAASACGIDGWGWPGLLGTMTRHVYFPLFSNVYLKTFLFVCLSPYPSRNSLFSVRPLG